MSEEKRENARAKFERLLGEETREHLKAAHKEIRHSFEAIFPPEFIGHRRAARREMLMAARSFIDHALERMEKDSSA